MTLQEDKKTAIIEKVTSIPLSEWILVKEQGKYDRYETTLNEVPIQLWTCMTDAGRPFIRISSFRFWDEDNQELIYTLLGRLNKITAENQEQKEEDIVDEIFNKLTL